MLSLLGAWWNLLLPEQILSGAALLLSLVALWVAWRSRGGMGPPLPPGPWSLPVVGYLPFLDPKAPHRSLAEVAKKVGGGIAGVWLGSVYAVIVSDPQLVRDAFSREEFTGRAPLYLTHGIMKGNGIICAEGEKWKISRRFAASFLKTLGMVRFPGPRRDALERRIMIAVKKCLEGFCEEIKNSDVAVGKMAVEINPLPELLHGIGNLMSDLVFGRTWKKDDPTWKWLQSLQEEGTKLIGVAGPLNFLPFLRFIPYYKKTIQFLMEGKQKTHEIYRQFILDHIDDIRRAEDEAGAREKSRSGETGEDSGLEGAGSREGAEEPHHKRGPNDAIEAFLMQPRVGLSGDTAHDEGNILAGDTQLHHLLADLFGAGLDTTLATLRWFLLLVAVNPHVQDLIQDELDNVLGGEASKRRPITMLDSSSLPYTVAAIAETQRMRPVVPLGIPHGALKETTLGGYRIPRGTMIVPLQWILHNDESTWGPGAENNYDPSRFLDSEGRFSNRKELHFMPFQSGRRVCVGEELAHMLLFLFGASILHEFRLSLPDSTEVRDVLEGHTGITLTPKPHRIMFQRRFPSDSRS